MKYSTFTVQGQKCTDIRQSCVLP